MPVLKDLRKTVTTNIPSIEGSEVVLYDEKNAGDQEALLNLPEDMPRGTKVLEYLKMSIKSWNLTDEKKKALPVTIESLRFLTTTDLDHLATSTTEGRKNFEKGKEMLEEEAVGKGQT